MKTRREFIQGTLTASVVSTLTITPLETLASAPVGQTARMPFYAALFDRRFSDGTRFAATARRLGIATRPIAGDATGVWYSELHPRWKEAAVPIAGLTTYTPLFCLERLAWDHDMRVVYRASHRRRADGSMEHRLESAGQPSEMATATLSGLHSWPSEIAALITRISPLSPPLPLNLRKVTATTCVSRCAAPRDELREALYSWVIAPRVRV